MNVDDVTEPLPIRKLQESLINKIAAGEIIHRPASALKELLENSLDAGSTFIKVTAKDGGMKLLQIQDNGCGIRKSDLPILAERFTTSKISEFSDLYSLTTYGFRGEALASISHVAKLTVITKTKDENCAWKASYMDGVCLGGEAKPCAGNDGTTITIEDLFYNTPTRLSALRGSSEEYGRILDVVTKYAIHNPKVSFMCKKSASPSPSISTPSASTTPQAIRLLYGHAIARELIDTTVVNDSSSNDMGDWKAEAFFTSANYQAKKTVFLLFINHRLVESSRMKRALESVYIAILPKGSSPFVYLSLLLPPDSVDVNVHPTKSAVHFLHEAAIIDAIADKVAEVLAARNGQSRQFDVGKQTLLTDAMTPAAVSAPKQSKRAATDDAGEQDDVDLSDDRERRASTLEEKAHVYSHHKVRTSLKDRTLDSMFPVMNPSQLGSSANAGSSKGKGAIQSDAIDIDMPEDPSNEGTQSRPNRIAREIKESECYLTSVQSLRKSVVKGKHKSLTEIMTQHIFVGIVDLDKSLSLIQHSTKLYLVNHSAFAEELFYQLSMRQFGDLPRIKLHPPPVLRELVRMAIDVEDIPAESQTGEKVDKDTIADRITDILQTRREMLSEYFSLDISASGEIESIPLLLPGYTPCLDKLPYFLMRLGPQVNWTSEIECFESFLRELAYFYVPGPGPFSGRTEEDLGTDEQTINAERWQIQHVVFPAFRRYLIAPKNLLDDGAVVQVANLPDLYKVFERC